MTARLQVPWRVVPALWTTLAVATALAETAPANAIEPGVDISLSASSDQSDAAGPYRVAELTVTNNSSEVLREIHLRWTEGGPTLVLPVALARGTPQTMRVWLPAGSQLQTYRATFPDHGGLGPVEATLSWPIEQVTHDALISPATYAEHLGPPPAWPGAMRRNILLGAAIAALAAAATLFLRKGAARIGVLLAVLAAASTAGALMLRDRGVLVENVIAIEDEPTRTDASPQDQSPSQSQKYLYIVSCRRTTRWSHGDANIAPVYRDDSQLYGETMTRHPRRGVSVVITPGELRLFRSASPR